MNWKLLAIFIVGELIILLIPAFNTESVSAKIIEDTGRFLVYGSVGWIAVFFLASKALGLEKRLK